MAPPRVVSLVPSVTETLLAWGIEPVAVTRFCEQPGYPAVGGTKDPDLDAIVALRPDLVVMDEEENRREDHDALVAAGVEVYVSAVCAVADVAPELARLAGRLGVAVAPAAPLPSPPATRGRVFVPIWRRPWMTLNGDTYGSTVLGALGFTNVFAGDADRYPVVELADVAGRGCDLVVLPSEPYPFAERHRPELSALGAPSVLVDGRDLFWWGVRTPGALERLAAILA